MPAYLLGKDAAIYYSTTALTSSNASTVLGGTPGPTEVTNVMDVTVDVSTEYVDVTTRADGAAGFRTQAPTFKNASVSFDMKWLPGDTVFTALKTAWATDATVAMYILDQKRTVTGAQGLAGNFSVSFSKEEPLADIQKASVTLTLSDSGQWFTKT
jgi:hypothetical protein